MHVKKLSLHKETLRRLEDSESNQVNAGAISLISSCDDQCTTLHLWTCYSDAFKCHK